MLTVIDTVHRSLLHKGLQSCRLVQVPILNPGHHNTQCVNIVADLCEYTYMSACRKCALQSVKVCTAYPNLFACLLPRKLIKLFIPLFPSQLNERRHFSVLPRLSSNTYGTGISHLNWSPRMMFLSCLFAINRRNKKSELCVNTTKYCSSAFFIVTVWQQMNSVISRISPSCRSRPTRRAFIIFLCKSK